jgi:hypothetical protein
MLRYTIVGCIDGDDLRSIPSAVLTIDFAQAALKELQAFVLALKRKAFDVLQQ